jgi:hypothetical protein
VFERIGGGEINSTGTLVVYSLIKKKKTVFSYKEIQKEAVAKSYMRKGFLIYEEMRKYLVKYEEAFSHNWLCNCSLLNFLIYEENFILFFISVQVTRRKGINENNGIGFLWNSRDRKAEEFIRRHWN